MICRGDGDLDTIGTMTRVERGRTWLGGVLNGHDPGPIAVPEAIISQCKVGWTISGVVGRLGRRWQLVEAWNVYPR